MWGRLNLFQRMMLRWSDLHPYLGVHVVRIRRPFAEIQLAPEIARCLEAAGLTGLVLDPKQRRFRYEGGCAEVMLTVLAGVQDPVGALHAEIERQLNIPFRRHPQANPFRFFAVPVTDSFYLGLAYDHFIAGGDSIALLLRGITEGVSGGAPGGASAPVPELYPATYRSLVVRHPAAFLKGLFSLPGLVAASRRSYRPRYRTPDDPRNEFAHFRLEPGQFAALRGTAKTWGATVNDVLLASLLQALSPLASDRRRAPRRRELAVASIVNTRQDFGADAQHAFGQFLASFRVSHPVPQGMTLRQLVQELHRETTRIKRRKLYLQTIMALGATALMWPFLSVGRRHGFFAKYYPAWGGLTALNVDALWGSGIEPEDYLRAVSTGPLCPLVFAVTTARDALHVGVSYRPAAFSGAAVKGVMEEFVRCIESLKENEN